MPRWEPVVFGLKRRIVHGTSLDLILIFCKKLLSEPPRCGVRRQQSGPANGRSHLVLGLHSPGEKGGRRVSRAASRFPSRAPAAENQRGRRRSSQSSTRSRKRRNGGMSS